MGRTGDAHAGFDDHDGDRGDWGARRLLGEDAAAARTRPPPAPAAPAQPAEPAAPPAAEAPPPPPAEPAVPPAPAPPAPVHISPSDYGPPERRINALINNAESRDTSGETQYVAEEGYRQREHCTTRACILHAYAAEEAHLRKWEGSGDIK